MTTQPESKRSEAGLRAQAMRASLPSRWLADALGIEIVSIEPDRVVATMPVDERTRQPYGILHGGASVALAETVCSIGSTLNLPDDNHTGVGLEINANHIRAKKDGVVTAVGRPIHVGKRTQVWEIRIEDEQHKLVCLSRCTIAVIPKGAHS